MFRFTLRDVFWATLVLGLGLGWWLHVRRLKDELTSVQSDLLYQADLVEQFVATFEKMGCEIPPESDSRYLHSGPDTKVFYPPQFYMGGPGPHLGLSATVRVPRKELRRTLDGEYTVRFRHDPAIQAFRARNVTP